MRVADCLGDDFTRSCAELAGLVAASFSPDLVVAIRTGGAVVAGELRAAGLTAPVVEVDASRPDSGMKRRLHLDALLRRVPRAGRDRLRSLDMDRRARRHARGELDGRNLVVPPAAAAAIAAAAQILVVDDAIDSGATIKAVLDRIAELRPQATVRVAALTVTFPDPAVEPDFALHRGVTLRFPWSADAGRAAGG